LTLSARQRLRNLEDAVFGEDAVRVGGKIERGSGSAYYALDPITRANFDAIDRLIEAEDKLVPLREAVTAASDRLAAALADHAAAEKAVGLGVPA
jgi:hypothetical protein